MYSDEDVDESGQDIRFFARAIIGGFLAVCSTMLLMPEAASAQGSSRTGIEIDHSSTGFPLSGGHAQVVCERCHLQGIFRGTPTQCMQCHSPGGRVVSTFKPTNHIPTTVNCSSCHRTTNWTPAFFTHNGVAPGTCSRCHNQTIASGKPATHIPTTMACDSCHRTVGWTGAAFKHTGVGPGTCADLPQRYPGSGEVGWARVYYCFVRFLPSSGCGELGTFQHRLRSRGCGAGHLRHLP